MFKLIKLLFDLARRVEILEVQVDALNKKNESEPVQYFGQVTEKE